MVRRSGKSSDARRDGGGGGEKGTKLAQKLGQHQPFLAGRECGNKRDRNLRWGSRPNTQSMMARAGGHGGEEGGGSHFLPRESVHVCARGAMRRRWWLHGGEARGGMGERSRALGVQATLTPRCTGVWEHSDTTLSSHRLHTTLSPH
jgi:hypothetical protein